jgi:Flp pilus assembly pilin Flp
MKSLFTRFVREDQGQDLIEYALLATFISIVAAGGATLAGNNLLAWYNALAGRIATMSAIITG